MELVCNTFKCLYTLRQESRCNRMRSDREQKLHTETRTETYEICELKCKQKEENENSLCKLQ